MTHYQDLGKAPVEYVCGGCKTPNIKLWRPMTLNPSRLLSASLGEILRCARCAGKLSQRCVDDMDARGMLESATGHTNCIGSYVPAVPLATLLSFYHHQRMPAEAKIWWESLPSLSPAKA